MLSNSTQPPASIKGGMYALDKKLGAGCFGSVYLGHCFSTKESVAVKFEALCGSIAHEVNVLEILSRPVRPQGVPQCLYHGQEGRYRCMVMERLGSSLEDLMERCEGQFSVQSTVLVAEQLLNRMEYLHSKGIVHRDIKPENFLFGVGGKLHHLYVIDFGFSKKYFAMGHAQFKTNVSLTGTARYASINSLKGNEQSRRDDLEALGHMLFYFIRGSLPWSGLHAKTPEERTRKICEKKLAVKLDELCHGFPAAFKIYLKATRSLRFEERPDYNGLRKLFRDVRDTLGSVEDHQFQWLEGENLGPLEPLIPNDGNMTQPDDDMEIRSKQRGAFCLCGRIANVKD